MTAEMDCNQTLQETREYLEREMEKAMDEFHGAVRANDGQLTEYKAYLVGRWSMGRDVMAIIGGVKRWITR